MRGRIAAAAAVVAALVVGSALTASAAGPQTNRLDVQFTNSAGVRSEGHVFAAGLDWTRPVGLMLYADGSSEYGLENPNSTYLLDADGTAGLVEAARRRNMVLVTPEAPGGNCPDGGGECWYQASGGVSIAAKTRWAYDFATQVKTDYPIDARRIVIGGYSSGAQFTTEYFGPQYGEVFGADLMVAISYGGSPKVTPSYSAAFKAATPVVWDTGSNDSAYTTTSSYGVKAGEQWYRQNGFRTELNVVQGLGHGRSGQFDDIMGREVDQYIPAGAATPSPTPSASPTPTSTPVPTVTPTPSSSATPTSTISPSPTITATPTATPTTPTARPYFQAADWYWKPIPVGAALDPNSATWAGYLAQGQHSVSTHDYGTSVVRPEEVDATTPRYSMPFSQQWGPNPFGSNTVPIPNGTQVPPMATTYGDDGDGHLTVMDDTTGKVWSTWQTRPGPWRASWGGVAALDGDGRETVGSSTASNISRAAGIIGTAELKAAAAAGIGLGHTLTASTDIAAPTFRYPASKSDGNNQGGVAVPIPQGTRLYLDPAVDVAALNATPAEKVIARTLQTHGAVIGDKGGSRLGFGAEYDDGNASTYSSVGLADYRNLTGIPWNRLRVLANSNPS